MEDARLLQGALRDVAAPSDARGKCANGLLPPTPRSCTPRDRAALSPYSHRRPPSAPACRQCQCPPSKTSLALLNNNNRSAQRAASCGGDGGDHRRGERCQSWSQMRSSSTEAYPSGGGGAGEGDDEAGRPARSASARSGGSGGNGATPDPDCGSGGCGGSRRGSSGCGGGCVLDAQTQTEAARLLDVGLVSAAVLDHCSSSKYESTISDIGVEYMRANGGLGRFKQLQRPDATPAQSAELASSCRTLNCAAHLDDSRTAAVTVCSTAAEAQQPPTTLLPLLPLVAAPQSAASLLGKGVSGEAAGMGAVVAGDGRELQEHHYVGYRLGRRKMLGERRKKIADYCLAFAMFGLMMMIAETELCNVAHLYRKEDAFSYVLKSLIGASTAILLAFIGIYHAVDLQLYLIDNCIEDWRIAMTWPRIAQIAIELAVCAIHPIPGAYYFKWAIYDRSSATWRVADVPVDIVFSLPMFTRLYLIVRTLMLHSKLFTDASSRSIGALNKISFNTRFVLKTLMTMCPGTVLVVFLVTLWLVAGWTLRCCEHHHDIVFANYLNALYMVAITFLSVGYGDIVPLTYCGRGIAVGSGLMGAGCTALVVAVVANKLQLTRAEKHVHNFMLDTQLTKKLKDAAANVLRETWLIYKHTRLVKRINTRRVRRHQQKFLTAIQELRKVKVLQRKLNDEASSMVDLAKTQAQVHELVTEMKQQHIQMENHVARIESALRSLQLQVETIPSAVGQVLMEKQASSSFISALEVNAASYDSPGYRGPYNRLHRQSSLDSSNC